MDNQFGIINKINKDTPYECYKHSKYTNPSSIFILLVLSTIGTLILSAIYSYAIHYIPLVFLNVICTIFFGYFTGIIIGISGKIAKIRNSTVLTVYGIIFGLFAVYSSWVIWLFELFQRQGWTFNPVTILHIMQFLSIEGVWSSGSFTPTGFLLYIIWFVEAAIIVGGCIYASSTYIKNDAFCEKCNAWVKDRHVLPNLNYTYNSNKLKNLLHQGQFSALSDLKIQDPPNDSYTAVELSKCSNCDELYLLTVNIVEIIKKSDGNFKTHKTTVVQNMIIDSEIYESIKSWEQKELLLSQK